MLEGDDETRLKVLDLAMIRRQIALHKAVIAECSRRGVDPRTVKMHELEYVLGRPVCIITLPAIFSG